MSHIEEIDDPLPPPVIENKEVSYYVVRDQVYQSVSKQLLNIIGFTLDSDVYKYSADGSVEKNVFIKNRHRFLTNDSFKDSYQMTKWLREHGKLPEYMEIKMSGVCSKVRNNKRKDKKEYAVYSKKVIKQGTALGSLTGQIRPFVKNLFTSGYCFPIIGFNTKDTYFIDCENFTFANWSRFINHSDDNPAVEFQLYNMQLFIVANRDINEGEEITADYGKFYWKEIEEERPDNVTQ